MYAPQREIWHTTYHHGGENQRIVPPSNNRFFFHQKREQEPDYCNKNACLYPQQPHITNRNRPMDSNLYPSQRSHRRREPAWPVWKYNMRTEYDSEEEYMRKTLVRLLASSKRTSYTRKCLKQRFSAEKRRIFHKRNPYSSGLGNHDEDFLIVDGANFPKDKRNNNQKQAELASIKLERKERLIDELEKGVILEPERHATDGNVHGYHENDKRSSVKSTRYYYSSLSLTVIEDEEASLVQKSKFEW